MLRSNMTTVLGLGVKQQIKQISTTLSKEHKSPILSILDITIHINNQANTEAAAKNDPPKPGPVTTIGIEETTGKKKEKSPNTERKVVDRHVEPRTELDSNDIHQPSDDDSGEKAINHTQFENPSAAGQSSRPQTHHAQENQDTKAKVMMYSGEVDRQDLGS